MPTGHNFHSKRVQFYSDIIYKDALCQGEALILITTSDYLPKLGGLTTFTRNLEFTLRELGIPYEIFHWKSIEEIKQYDPNNLNKYEFIINVHVMFSWLLNSHHDKMINFIHGSEILFTSPNPLKAFYKRIQAKNFLNKLEKCHFNFFISEATLEKIKNKGFRQCYSRDLIFHNCIPMNDANYSSKDINKEELKFSCIVRNVPHKNLLGSVQLCEQLSILKCRKVKLFVPKGSNISSSLITIEELVDFTDESKDKALSESHFNLLLSKDDSNKGFFEGFGLTVLEAARFGTPSIVFNTGGLTEAVHDEFTGVVIDGVNDKSLKKIERYLLEKNYKVMAQNCFEHTVNSHSIDEYKRLLRAILIHQEAA